MTVLVTGGAGYIGSHMGLFLADAGVDFVILDNLTTGFDWAVNPNARFVEGDVGDFDLVSSVIADNKITDIVHFAGSIVVPESVSDPLKYYANNTSASRTLIEAAVRGGVERFVFSSTAAVYGMTGLAPVVEDTPLEPVSPYGRSKLMTEWMLRDVSAAHGLNYGILRYFNVAGADPDGRAGQSTPEATHLIKVAVQTALGKREKMSLFGDDYETPDGTCVRDYIHVTDLIAAHGLLLEHLRKGGENAILNCAYGHGYSVREVIDTVKQVTGVDFAVEQGPRRAGDPASITATGEKVREVLGWRPEHDDLGEIVKTAYAWERYLMQRNRD